MFQDSHTDRLRKLFADQFYPDGTGYIYRKHSKDAAIRVTGAERDEFVARFNKSVKMRLWGVIPAVLALITVLVLFVPDLEGTAGQISLYAGTGLIIAFFVGLFYHAWNAPNRALERRAIVAQPLTRQQARRSALEKLTYGQLGAAVLAALALVGRQAFDGDVLHGWHVLWLVFAASLSVVAGVQAFRKWRFERER